MPLDEDQKRVLTWLVRTFQDYNNLRAHYLEHYTKQVAEELQTTVEETDEVATNS